MKLLRLAHPYPAKTHLPDTDDLANAPLCYLGSYPEKDFKVVTEDEPTCKWCLKILRAKAAK